MDDLLNDFLAETAEILAEAGGALVAWEADPGDRERLDAIFRLVHTIKGSSGFLSLPRVTALAHSAEDALDQVRRGNRPADAALVSAVLGVIDRLAELCGALGTGSGEPAGDDADVIDALAFADEKPEAPEPAEIRLRREDDLAAELQAWRSIRVPLPLLDSVMTGVTDIVLARNEFARMLRESGADPRLIASFDRLSDSIAGMRQSVSQMRMQRIDKLFAPLPRIVRDLAQDLGKKVKFVASGGEVELDREMMENIRDPLIHIVRNAIDHGIEPLDQRVAAGKGVNATLSVAARQSGNQIEIEVRDDGRGLSPDALVAKAIAARILTATEARALTAKDKLELIFRPGFSTASQVTSVSGRGVGMDIVKSNLEKIGGIVELRNDEGRGLAIILRVPMTLTIISGLMVRAAGQYFAIPRGSVREILLENSDSARIDRVGGGELATVRGEQFPLLRLEDILGRAIDARDDVEDRAIVIVRPGQGQSYALSVAGIHDHEELVIKPAAPLIMATGLYAGTTLPDNGRPVLLLDVQGLLAAAGIDASEAGRSRDEAADAEAEAVAARKATQLLLFRDAGGRIRGVRLSVIERVEEVPALALFESAGTVQAQIGGDIFPVHAAKLPEGSGAVKLLRLHDGQRVLCYPIEAVVDIVRLPDAVQPANAPGLIAGVALVGGEPVELLDPFWLMEQYARGGSKAGPRQPLCRLTGDSDGWGENFLAPILHGAGYRVASTEDAAADEAPDVLLCLSEDADPAAHAAGDVPVIRLRMAVAAAGPDDETVYRYDRQALLEALRARVGGGRP